MLTMPRCFQHGLAIIIKAMLPRGVLGLIRRGIDLDGFLCRCSLDAEFPRHRIDAARLLTAFVMRPDSGRIGLFLLIRQPNPFRHLFIVLQLCQLGPVQVFRDLPQFGVDVVDP
jgi:hypothetical protein